MAGSATLATIASIPAVVAANASDPLLSANHDEVRALVAAVVLVALLAGSISGRGRPLPVPTRTFSRGGRLIRAASVGLILTIGIVVGLQARWSNPTKVRGPEASGPITERFAAGSQKTDLNFGHQRSTLSSTSRSPDWVQAGSKPGGTATGQWVCPAPTPTRSYLRSLWLNLELGAQSFLGALVLLLLAGIHRRETILVQLKPGRLPGVVLIAGGANGGD